jgi:riboflavin kinase/FMN adenylyltransferase
MITISGTTEFQIEEETAVTIGKFDGLHLGHMRLMEAINRQKEQGLKSVVFTFTRSPGAVLSGEEPRYLTSVSERRELLERMGIDYLIEYPFDEPVRTMDPVFFVQKVLVGQLHVRYLAMGEDFLFGYHRAGNKKLLEELAVSGGYRLDVLKKTTLEGHVISSSYIKDELAKAHMEDVTACLGRPYQFHGRVVHGRALARTFGLPTLNMLPERDKCIPPKGVYCSKAVIRGVSYPALANIGTKPTVTNEQTLLIETHIFDYSEDLYGQDIRIELYDFLRPEQKFHDIESLRTQMEQDILCAKRYFGINEDEQNESDLHAAECEC